VPIRRRSLPPRIAGRASAHAIERLADSTFIQSNADAGGPDDLQFVPLAKRG